MPAFNTQASVSVETISVSTARWIDLSATRPAEETVTRSVEEHGGTQSTKLVLARTARW